MFQVDVVSRRLTVITTARIPDGSGQTRVLATRDDGESFHDISLRIPGSFAPDDLHFRDDRHGWLTVTGGGERLYRTDDGGRSWRNLPLPYPGPAGGSTDQVSFFTASDGWLAVSDPAGPLEVLSRTDDRGAHWHETANLRFGLSHRGDRGLPQLGPVELLIGSGVGWLGAEPGWNRAGLYRSDDGGRRWTKAPIPQAPGRVFPLPTIFGRRLLEPVSACIDRVLSLYLYTSHDGGRRWTQTSVLPVAGRPSCVVTVATTFPSATAAWAATAAGDHVAVYRTRDTGHHWLRCAALPVATRGQLTIQAASGTTAWVTAPEAHSTVTQVFVTTDRGHTWRRVDQLATR